ncbi:phage-related protein [Candidatus Termititenax aidoneus]|uniref:Phage-related protein n=1 Tax=Termititenax aidoneus TaxID=2218524 RepID=A0A388TCF6_TERA1|nr:phage-related protein [Candidatus Termititenax aidoneus]
MSKKDLKPIRSEHEAKEKGRNGGIKSGETRRLKRDYRQKVRWLLELKAPPSKAAKVAEKLGIPEGDIDNADVEIFAQHQKALSGSTRAAEFLRDSAGFAPPKNLNISGDMNNYNYEMDEKLRQLSVDELRALANGKTNRRGA